MTDMRHFKVLFIGSRNAFDIACQFLGSKFSAIYTRAESEELSTLLVDADVLLDASMKVRVSAEMIKRAGKLKLVVTATTGADHIDAVELEKRGIPLLTLKGQRHVLQELTAAAEHTWALIMACARHLPTAAASVKMGEWDRTKYPGLMLNGRRIGIVGMGRIGGWVARYASAFGMDVSYFDPMLEIDTSLGTRFTDLKDLVGDSDIVTVHVPLNEQTRGLIDTDVINRFKKGALFINTSRGEIADERALVNALKVGHISAVGVDVLSGEPDVEQNPLWQYGRDANNILITPHIGGNCPDAVARVVEFSCERINEYFDNK